MKLNDPDLIKIESVNQGAGEVPSIVAYVKREITLSDVEELYGDYKARKGYSDVKAEINLEADLSWESDKYIELTCSEWETGEDAGHVRVYELGGYLG